MQTLKLAPAIGSIPTAMMKRTIRRCLSEIPIPLYALPPTFPLPSRARYFNSTAQIIDSPPSEQTFPPPVAQTLRSTLLRLPKIPAPPELSTPLSLSDSTRTLMPLLASQPGHFITVHFHDRPYLVTQGDSIRLPFHMPGVIPGDVIRLNRASVLGSRDYTLKAAADKGYLDERLFECRARVVGVEAEPMHIKVKKKQRCRNKRTIKSKHKFTVLRVSELRVKGLEELEAEAAV